MLDVSRDGECISSLLTKYFHQKDPKTAQIRNSGDIYRAYLAKMVIDRLKSI